MILEVGERAARHAIEGGLAAASGRAVDMHIALVSPLGRRQTPLGWMVKADADPDAWDALAAWCERYSTVPVGASPEANREAARMARAATRIEQEMVKLAKHPGYRGVAVAGVSRVALPARRCGGGRWWPTTRMALAHSDGSTAHVEDVMLLPEQVERGRRTYTRWLSPPGS